MHQKLCELPQYMLRLLIIDICILPGNYKFGIQKTCITLHLPYARPTRAHYSSLSNGQSFAQRLGNSCRTREFPFSGFSKVAHERLSRLIIINYSNFYLFSLFFIVALNFPLYWASRRWDCGIRKI